MNFVLVRDDRADVVRPICLAASPGSLLRLDHAPAALADLSCGVGEVIFPGLLAAFAEVGIRDFPALAVDIALLWCVSGCHLSSFHAPAPTCFNSSRECVECPRVHCQQDQHQATLHTDLMQLAITRFPSTTYSINPTVVHHRRIQSTEPAPQGQFAQPTGTRHNREEDADRRIRRAEVGRAAP